jgi:hypothetical protein
VPCSTELVQDGRDLHLLNSAASSWPGEAELKNDSVCDFGCTGMMLCWIEEAVRSYVKLSETRRRQDDRVSMEPSGLVHVIRDLVGRPVEHRGRPRSRSV